MNFAPVLFVLLWSTGFVGAKYGLPYADPFIFLALRVFIAAILFYSFALITRAPIALKKQDRKMSALVGATLHFAYLGGVFYGISQGVPAGIAATITSLQPILVSVIGIKVLNEEITKKQIIGLICGFAGVATVLSPAFSNTSSMTFVGITAVFIALLGSTTATLVQKKSGGSAPLLSGTAFQYVVASGLFFIAAALTRGFRIEWTGKFIFAFTWLIFALSVGAVLVLLTLLKHGSASKVSSLFYLVPPVTAVEAYFLFQEKLTSLDLFGILLTVFGVFLVMKKERIF